MIKSIIPSIALFTGSTLIPLGSKVIPNIDQDIVIFFSSLTLLIGIVTYVACGKKYNDDV